MSKSISAQRWLVESILDFSLEKFLEFMAWAIENSHEKNFFVPRLQGYYRNVENFNAVFVFASQDNSIHATARFIDRKMFVEPEADKSWNVKIVFSDVNAFWKLMLSSGDGIVEAMQANETQVFGNLNYLYKFGFLLKDLIFERLGLEPFDT